MSNQGFTFPPPPPPPSKKDVLPGTPYGDYRQGNRGGPSNRGNNRGRAPYGRGPGSGGNSAGDVSYPGSRGGGRGQSFTRAAPLNGGFVGHRGWSQGYSNRSNGAPGFSPAGFENSHSPRPTSPHGHSQINASQKRDYSSAFNSRARGGSKPLAAPAVPSFLSSIPGLSPPTTSTALASTPKGPSEKKPKQRTTNILGLNPSAHEPISGSDDEDEEAKLASTITGPSQTGLTYEYRGQIATLKTPAEIAAWIAERRKRYPTAAKAEHAKNEAEEKKRKWDEEKKRTENKANVPRWTKGSSKISVELKDDVTEEARLKTEKLIKKAAKTQRQLAKARDALKKAQQASALRATSNTQLEDEEGIADIMDAHAEAPGMQSSKHVEGLDYSDGSSTPTDGEDEDTSSSGSSSEESESNSDSVPEIQTTKRPAPDRLHPPPRPTPPSGPAPQKLCRNLLSSGVCKHGTKCRYSHVLPNNLRGPDAPKRVESSPVTGRPRRKNLWEVMVEKERDEERKQVLRAIVELGDRGLLDE